MERIEMFKCSCCGKLFYDEKSCSEHEDRMKKVIDANKMLKEGKTLLEINEKNHIWSNIPEHLLDCNKDNCFKISYLQCCEKPAYQISYIYEDGAVDVGGYCSYPGYYSARKSLNDRDLKDPRPLEELYIYKNFC